MGTIRVTCPRCGTEFYMSEYECKACPNCGFVVCGPESDSSGCFITTAVVKGAGLPDNAHELETLRKFRDSYLKKTQWGRELVEEYYRIAPSIVKAIEKDPDKEKVYKNLLKEIREIVRDIEENKYSQAVQKYKSMVLKLKEKYSVN